MFIIFLHDTSPNTTGANYQSCIHKNLKLAIQVKTPNDVAWACVLVLESLEPVVADPEFGPTRPLVPRLMREKAREMANAWKEGLEARGGVEGSKPADAHAFLQLVVTFGIVLREEIGLYRKIVVSFSWRRQMPKLALAVGLEDEMDGMDIVFLHFISSRDYIVICFVNRKKINEAYSWKL
jgi:Frigida-like protein